MANSTAVATKDLPAPQYAFARLVTAYEALERPQRLQDLRSRWEEYLVAHQRVWNKCEGQFRTAKAWPPIQSEFAHRRNRDRALIYLQQARHADEHGIQPITKSRPGGFAVGGRGTIRSMRIDDAGRLVEFDASPGITLTIESAQVIPIAVTNRGVTYQPPAGSSLL